MTTFFRAALAALISLSLVGCGGNSADEPRHIIRGKLTDGGKPFDASVIKMKLPKGTAIPPGTQPLTITFLPVGTGEVSAATVTDPGTGTFELKGNDGKGVRLGKYKVSVVYNTGPGTPDAFGGKYTPDKTNLTTELKAGEEVVIDVSKPKG